MGMVPLHYILIHVRRKSLRQGWYNRIATWVTYRSVGSGLVAKECNG
jgi:hypothetical protein